jgi:rSAM/selenodomain-associated transferase 1
MLTVAKRPTPGQTKTRLTPYLAPGQAAALYECFLRDTIELIRQIPDIQPVIAYLPAFEKPYFSRLAPEFELILQEGSNLGTRLNNALNHYLSLGHERAVIMNSDSPTLPVEYLLAAFRALKEEADVTIGPCEDGGYYLIGLKRPAPRLFREVRMSTCNVVKDTLALVAEEGLTFKMLPTWYDVDDADALLRLKTELNVLPPEIASHTRALITSMPID